MNTKKTLCRNTIIGIFLIASGIVFGHQIIYNMFIVPDLKDKIQLSIWEWSLNFCPVFLTCIIAGIIHRNSRYTEAVYTVVGSAIFNRIYFFFLVSQQVGHYKSLAIESPLLFWSIGLVIIIFLYGLFVSLGFILSTFFKGREGQPGTGK